jgi:hypothetical protein
VTKVEFQAADKDDGALDKLKTSRSLPHASRPQPVAV